MNLVTVISTRAKKTTQRLIKVLRFGKDDVQEALQATPHGIDSNPIKGMIAVYSPTTQKGETVILGYINKNQLTSLGETRVYSTDADGKVLAYAWFNNEGVIEFNGNTDNLIRYSALDNALQLEVNKINAELTKIATALNGIIPGIYVFTPVTINTIQSKIGKLKTTQTG